MSELFSEAKIESSSDTASKEIRVDDTLDKKFDDIDQDIDDFVYSEETERIFTQLDHDAENFEPHGNYLQRLMATEFKINFNNASRMIAFLAAFASMAAILAGVDQSIISGATIGMEKDLQLTSSQQSLVSSLTPLGATFGSLGISFLTKYFGRKGAIIWACILYTIGGGLCAGSRSYHMMYAGRFFLGLGIGVEGGVVCVYVAECVPPRIRGSLVSLYQFNIALGEVLGFAIAAIFYEVKGGWRYMVGSSVVFSTIVLIGLLFLPESPRYLALNGRIAEAWSVWKRLRDVTKRENKIEFLQMRQAAIEEEQRVKSETRWQQWGEIFLIPRNRRGLVHGVIMIALGQLVGANGILYYLSTLMSHIGFSEKNSVFMSLVGGGSLLVGTIPGVLLMDKFGRRTWSMMIIGLFTGLVLVGVGYLIPLDKNLPAAEGVYLTGIIVYMLSNGSYACLTWVIPSECFDLRTRSLGMSICSGTLYLMAFIITYNFNRMQAAMTYTGVTLGFYGGIAFLGFIYQLCFMPETKNRTLEEIDEIFSLPVSSIFKENISNLKKGIISGNI
ncbi:hypothetical protein WICMUC_004369 [Wickerhamomyces mucosus]|uniref:Major facilitator superfamily (MFS) profile domain-containing protein n=1 Tax=Wickerhamomyces mucosus TaxID=1378264 RepID=A0A9P8TB39_9ASCO|nr:hypothetical protein WICMUC_004369 [Wickerhamomyces mucosus]